MARERTQVVWDGFSSAMRIYGVPGQVLTDNGKVFHNRALLCAQSEPLVRQHLQARFRA